MYFLTGITDRLIIRQRNITSGRSKSLEDESLTTEVLMNILELLEAVTEVAQANQEFDTSYKT